MEPNAPYRPRVSRETRLLLTAGALAIAALWLLARVRFQDRPITPNPVTPVLSQLVDDRSYDDLASEMAALQSRLRPWVRVLELAAPADGSPPSRRVALRVADELAIAMLGTAETPRQGTVRAKDDASGLALVGIPPEASSIPVGTWTPERLTQPRYFVAADSTMEEVSFWPVFVSSLAPRESARWSAPIWTLPSSAAVAPGTLFFSTSAAFVGLVVQDEVGTAVVPGATVLTEAQRLLGAPPREPGSLGVDVQPLTEALAAVTGVKDGVVVSWVDPHGAAAALRIGDVVEAVDDRAMSTVQHWGAFVARVTAGQQVQLRVRRRHDVRSMTFIASAVVKPTPTAALGLVMRVRRGVGVEVVRVEAQSAGERSGLIAGDFITLIGETEAPTPSQVAGSYAALEDGGRTLIGVTRGRGHLVLVLER